ncbi:MAG: hypothetical protein U0746_13825 [Gemmataceae bacterium]
MVDARPPRHVCNVEMPPAVLIERQLARLSGIDLSDIRHRRLTADHAGRLGLQTTAASPTGSRSCNRRSRSTPSLAPTTSTPGCSSSITSSRVAGRHAGPARDQRATVELLMSAAAVRVAGVAVLAVAAVGRARRAKDARLTKGWGWRRSASRAS